ncbi:hypothetical protein HYV86_03335 [Candidatus Woesearchaeota archaeon]|nr:hypothetical protein [Candidatus Woesearchaeota archaeon]
MQLHPEQEYVYRHAADLGIQPRFYIHETATEGKTKVRTLPEGITVVCAYYFGLEGRFIGVVTACEPRRLSQRDLFSQVLGISRAQGKRYDLRAGTPKGMDRETCTPWMYHSSAEHEIQALIIDEGLDALASVDISIGGSGEEAQRTSMHLRGEGVYTILQREFGTERIRKHPP